MKESGDSTKKKQADIMDYLSFQASRYFILSRKPDLCGAGKRRSESKGRIAPKRKTYLKARRADQVGEIGFKEPSQQVEAQERLYSFYSFLALQVCILCSIRWRSQRTC